MPADVIRELMGRAFTLTRQGRLADAEPLLVEICEQDSSIAKAWFMRGAIRFEFGDTDGAIEYLSTAVGLDLESAEAHFALCKLYLSRDNLAEAISQCKRVVELDAKHAEAWLALGCLYADSGQFQQAERASRVAIDLLPGVAEPRINLVNALISQGKHVEAIALCNGIKADESPRPGIWHSLGLAFKALGEIQEAEQCLSAVTRSDPENSAAFCALGEIKAAQDEVAQAQSLYMKARELNPVDPRVHFQLGKVLLPNSSARHAELVELLQRDHQYRDISEARNIARELATGLVFDDAAVECVLARFFDEHDPSGLYPFEWWIDALMQFGDRRRASDTALRSVYSTVFSWSLPCRQALDEIATFCGKRLASYGSGSGYWEWLLSRHYGIDFVCHDMALRHRFLPTKKVLHSDATVDPEDTVFLAWLPGEAAIESLLDQMEPGQGLVLIGEPADDAGHPRTCGNHRFFHYLRDEFETRATVPLANYAYFQDRVDLLVRR
jgi:tetratricopeptide (TPR) repeat protein